MTSYMHDINNIELDWDLVDIHYDCYHSLSDETMMPPMGFIWDLCDRDIRKILTI